MKTFDIALKHLKDFDFKSYDMHNDNVDSELPEGLANDLNKCRESFVNDADNTYSNNYYRSICLGAALCHLSDLENGRASWFYVACEIIESEKDILQKDFEPYKNTVYPKLIVEKFDNWTKTLNPIPLFLSDKSEVKLDFFCSSLSLFGVLKNKNKKMAENSNIEWTNHTINLHWGCVKVNEGCDNCYAETFSKRFDGGKSLWGNDAYRKEIKSSWTDLDKFQKKAHKNNEKQRVFVGSMMDIFEKSMPIINHKGELQDYTTDKLRQKLFDNISNNMYPNLIFLFLTKRPSNINKYIPKSWKENPPENVMFGTSIVNQETADNLIPHLLEVKGIRFLSLEPQLGEVDLLKRPLGKDTNSAFKKEFYRYIDCVSLVIQGGESGHNKRPFNLDWAYSMKKQCEIANVPYFFKQIDKVKPIPEDLKIREFPDFSNKK